MDEEPRRGDVSAESGPEAEAESEFAAEASIELAVSDVRQWTFCPRVLWHRRMMPHRTRETPKMALGRDAQSALEGLERRRTGQRYGFDRATRMFNVPLSSKKLRVRGFCDAVLTVPDGDVGDGAGKSDGAGAGASGGVNPGEGGRERRGAEGGGVYPVEVKWTEGEVSGHHVVQLAGYALLLEEEWGLAEGSVSRGFLVLLPAERLVPVELGRKLRESFVRSLGEIRSMLMLERFPEPTKHLGFCPQCEYVRFCGDVL